MSLSPWAAMWHCPKLETCQERGSETNPCISARLRILTCKCRSNPALGLPGSRAPQFTVLRQLGAAAASAHQLLGEALGPSPRQQKRA